MLILTGPTAAGKNTIGKLLAVRRKRCAVVDFDLVRRMFIQPHQPPWAGEEGKSQQMLGVRQVCKLAKGFAAAGWEVIILDVLSNETAKLYKRLLKNVDFNIVQLLPAFEELKRRFYERGACLTDEELQMIYQEQSEFTGYDLRIDNTAAPPETVAKTITPLL
jgi:adenylylsulfate kinase-like enzyme